MNIYKITSTKTVQYVETIKAASEEEAEKLYNEMIETDGTAATEIWGSAEVSIDNILED